MSLLTNACQGIFSVPAHLNSLFCAHQRKDPPLQGSWKKQYWVFSSILINWEKRVLWLRKPHLMVILKSTCSEFYFFLISLKMQRMQKSLCRNLGRTPFAYGHFWLSCWHISTIFPSLQPIFLSPKRKWKRCSHMIIFRTIVPIWWYHRHIYLIMFF